MFKMFSDSGSDANEPSLTATDVGAVAGCLQVTEVVVVADLGEFYSVLEVITR